MTAAGRAAKTLVLSLICACGGAPRGAARGHTDVSAAFPVTATIPAHPTYLVVAGRLDRAAGLLRDLLRPFGAIENGIRPDALDRELRRPFAGASPINAADLAEVGFAFDGNVALYSTTVAPTLILPVADAAKLTAWLEKVTHEVTVQVSTHRGVQVTAHTDGADRVAFAIRGGWFYLHLGKASAPPTAWLDAILDARETAATDADVAWALARAEGRRDGFGLVRWPALVEAAAPLDGNAGDCKAVTAWAAGRARRVALSGAFAGKGKLDGRIDVEVTPDVEAAVRAAIAPAPDARFLALRADAAAWLDVGTLAGATPPRRPEGRACSLGGAFADLVALPRGGPFFVHALAALRVAVLAARWQGRDVELQAAAWITPAPTQAGEDLAVLLGAHLTLPHVVGPVAADARDGAVRVAIGRGVRERLDSASPGAPSPPELFALELQPDRIPDLKAVETLVAAVLPGDLAGTVALLCGQFRHVRLGVAVVPGAIRVVGGFELR